MSVALRKELEEILGVEEGSEDELINALCDDVDCYHRDKKRLKPTNKEHERQQDRLLKAVDKLTEALKFKNTIGWSLLRAPGVRFGSGLTGSKICADLIELKLFAKSWNAAEGFTGTKPEHQLNLSVFRHLEQHGVKLTYYVNSKCCRVYAAVRRAVGGMTNDPRDGLRYALKRWRPVPLGSNYQGTKGMTIAHRPPIKDGVVKGDVYVYGSNGSSLTSDEMDYITRLLAENGVRAIKGKIILDDSFFDDGPALVAALAERRTLKK